MTRKRTPAKHKQAFKSSDDAFRLLFLNHPVPMWVYDLETLAFLEVNDAAVRRYGYSRDEFLAMTLTNIRPPEDVPRLLENVARAPEGFEESGEWRHRLKDGRVIDVAITSHTLAFMGRNAKLVSAEDITERRRVEEAARQNEHLLSESQRIAHVGSWSWDFAGPIKWTDEMYRLYGVSPDTFTPTVEALVNLLHPEDRPAMQAWIGACAAGEEPGDLEFRTILPDGTVRLISGRGELMYDAGNRPTHMAGTARDITERKRAEALLQGQKQVLEMIATSVPLEGTLTTLLRVIEAQSAEMLCSILLLDPDGAHLRHCAAPRLPEGFKRAIDGEAIGACAGSCGTAAFRREAVLVEDIASDPLWVDYRELALRHGLRACWSTPIFDASYRVLGTFAIYYRQPGRPTAQHRRLIEIATHVAAIAISRQHAETALRASEERYRSLYVESRDAITVLTSDRGFLAGNPAAVSLFGCRDEEDFTARTPASLSPEHQPDGVLSTDKAQEMMRLALEKGSHSFEWTYRRPDGTDFSATVLLSRLERGGTSLFQATVRDITDQKRDEAALRLQSVALNAAANAMVITDRDGTVEWINPAFTALTGYSADEALGRNPRDLVRSGVHDQAFYQNLWDTVLAGHVWRCGDMTNRRKDGSLYQEAQTITPVKDARGAVTHFIAIKRDLTEQRHLEAQLNQAQRMESVGRLAGGIAHDFNNLLTVINSYAQLAAAELREGDPLHEMLQEIEGAGQRAAALTRQLLVFSRRQVVQPVVFDLHAVVADMEKMLQRLIGEDVALVVTPADHVGHVKADPGQIEQVIMNLAVNARDAMPAGGALTLETANVELDEAYVAQHATVHAGSYVMLAISDTGVGMDEATRERIFEPFFTTKGPGKGTGLGLSTVYGIVTQSGGHVWVYSEVGKGTTFKIYLPRVEEAADERRPIRTLAPARGTETILLVEDETAVRVLARRILEAAGYTVLPAANGGEALLILERFHDPVHLMMTDVVMPGMSGPELATRLSTLRPGMKVLYTSGYTDDEVVRRGILTDAVRFINKPYAVSELTRKVREVLDRPA
jgi:PAS domain S-box-containing protein